MKANENLEMLPITKEWLEQFEAEYLLTQDCERTSFKFKDLTGKEHEFDTRYAGYLIDYYKPLLFKKS